MAQTFGEMLSWVPKSRQLGESLSRAYDYARGQGHATVGLDHMLLALLDDPDAFAVLHACGIGSDGLITELQERFEQLEGGDGGEPLPAAELSKILEYAVAAARQSKRREVNGAIVLAAIVGEAKNAAAEILRRHGLTFNQAVEALKSTTVKQRQGDGDGRNGAHAAGEDGGAVTTEEILESARRRITQRGRNNEPQTASAVESHATPTVTHGAAGAVDGRNAGGGVAAAAPVQVSPAPPPPQQQVIVPPASPQPPMDVSAAPDSNMGAPAQVSPDGVAGATQGRRPAQATAGPGLDSKGARPRTMPPPIPPPAMDMRGDGVGFGKPAGGAAWQPQGELRPQGGALSGSLGRPNGSGANGVYPGRHDAGPSPVEVEGVETGQLVENIPRRMRVGVPEIIEVRVARSEIEAAGAGLRGRGGPQLHDIAITKAMSVRLRAPEGGFFVESASPETQWIDNVLGIYGEDFASWRFVVTPKVTGARPLQLIVSARTVGRDGLAADTALPDQVVTVRVRTNYARVAGKWLGWAVAVVIGGVLARFGEGMWAIAMPVVRSFIGPV